ncbi:hypothetical protein RF11_05987 [Thelohanellus kitauei]|uniref:Uncharacterized protein n=1 Tax=Thelohanellus kitauei TaxID=669202 RepID=A0A0C2MKV4_THEKT|nr:hypothetical protein RF11_05987 [Thelohanellus kitauei]
MLVLQLVVVLSNFVLFALTSNRGCPEDVHDHLLGLSDSGGAGLGHEKAKDIFKAVTLFQMHVLEKLVELGSSPEYSFLKETCHRDLEGFQPDYHCLDFTRDLWVCLNTHSADYMSRLKEARKKAGDKVSKKE